MYLGEFGSRRTRNRSEQALAHHRTDGPCLQPFRFFSQSHTKERPGQKEGQRHTRLTCRSSPDRDLIDACSYQRPSLGLESSRDRPRTENRLYDGSPASGDEGKKKSEHGHGKRERGSGRGLSRVCSLTIFQFWNLARSKERNDVSRAGYAVQAGCRGHEMVPCRPVDHRGPMRHTDGKGACLGLTSEGSSSLMAHLFNLSDSKWASDFSLSMRMTVGSSIGQNGTKSAFPSYVGPESQRALGDKIGGALRVHLCECVRVH